MPWLLAGVLGLGLVLGGRAAAAAENHLAGETSPYLLEHAHNPVDWFPWGAAAFAKATREDKPVFLSIGYATCHWCHVMAHESFEDQAVASYLNAHFVAIKVDREELPQVDAYYCAFVEIQNGSAGWPLTVFCSADRLPFFGTTYLPKDQLLHALQTVTAQWTSRRPALIAHGAEVVALLGQATVSQRAPSDLARLTSQAMAEFSRRFDELDGGFGEAPKFPQPPLLQYLLRPESLAGDARMVTRTLQALIHGGIHDQLGGGFHRYSVDAAWRVPHFEKMLLEQASLARTLLRASRILRDPSMRQTALETLAYAKARLWDPAGGFAAAEDADSVPAGALAESPPREGAYYVWRDADLVSALQGLGSESDRALRLVRMLFGLHPEGNVPEGLDARGDLAQANVLYQAHSTAECAAAVGLTVEQAQALAERCRAALLAARGARPPPRCERQILVGWNGLMVGTLALCDADGSQPQALADAEATARRLRANGWEDARGLSRVLHAPEAGAWHGATALDYAELCEGLILLHTVDGDASWLEWALQLQARLDREFLDPRNGTYFDSALENAGEVPARLRSDQDGAEAAANSVICGNLVWLSRATGDAQLKARVDRLQESYRAILSDHPESMPAMLAAMQLAAAPERRVVISVPTTLTAAEAAPVVRAFLQASWEGGDADLVRVVVPAPLDGHPLLSRYELLRSSAHPAVVSASYCSGTSCLPPTTDPTDLRRLIAQH